MTVRKTGNEERSLGVPVPVLLYPLHFLQRRNGGKASFPEKEAPMLFHFLPLLRNIVVPSLEIIQPMN